MIHFVIALAAEAAPIINNWRLKKFHNWHPFPVFGSDSCRLIISGIGKCNSAAATAWLASQSEQRGNRPLDNIWLNVGIAGHKIKPTGTIMSGHKITEQATGNCWYPTQITSTLSGENILTVDSVKTDYLQQTLHEMEASGFYSTAIRFTSAELVQCVKIVSDNHLKPVSQLNSNLATSLICDNMNHLVRYSEELTQLSGLCDPIDTLAIETIITNKWRFTVTQQRRLQRLLQRYCTIVGEMTELPPEFEFFTHSALVLETLQNKLDNAPVTLDDSRCENDSTDGASNN